MVLYYAPISGRYAILRMNPVATLEPFQYPDLIMQAQKMSPKKYLVYLDQVWVLLPADAL